MIRLEKRKQPLPYQGLVAAFCAVVIAFVVGCLIFAGLGVNPLTAYTAMGKGIFSSFDAFSEVLVKATPLIFTGLAVATAAVMMLWNIGAEGQLVWGGICAAGTALFLFPGVPGLAPHSADAGGVGAGRHGLVAHSSATESETQG